MLMANYEYSHIKDTSEKVEFHEACQSQLFNILN